MMHSPTAHAPTLPDHCYGTIIIEYQRAIDYALKLKEAQNRLDVRRLKLGAHVAKLSDLVNQEVCNLPGCKCTIAQQIKQTQHGQAVAS